MLGRLARWLRLVGYDAVYADTLSDHQIAARARAEGRVILTRDRELARRRGIRCLFIEGQELQAQLAQVFDQFGRPAKGQRARCPMCNAALDPAPAQEVKVRVPPYVQRTQLDFWRCPQCARIYWPGTHWQNVCQVVEQVLDSQDRHGDQANQPDETGL